MSTEHWPEFTSQDFDGNRGPGVLVETRVRVTPSPSLERRVQQFIRPEQRKELGHMALSSHFKWVMQHRLGGGWMPEAAAVTEDFKRLQEAQRQDAPHIPLRRQVDVEPLTRGDRDFLIIRLVPQFGVRAINLATVRETALPAGLIDRTGEMPVHIVLPGDILATEKAQHQAEIDLWEFLGKHGTTTRDILTKNPEAYVKDMRLKTKVIPHIPRARTSDE